MNFLVLLLTFVIQALFTPGLAAEEPIKGIGDLFSLSRSSNQVFEFQKIECTNNPAIVKVVCSFSPLVNSTGVVSIQQEYQRTLTAATGEFRVYYKPSSAKRYKPTTQRQKMDYCHMSGNKNSPNMLMLFMPAAFEKVIPSCPLSGRNEFNFTIPLIPIDPAFYRAGDYRVDVTFMTENEVAIWKFMGYMVARD